MLEEDLSLPNMALDLLGQARNLYSYAADREDAGHTEDDFAYLRTDREYRNCLLVERPNGDFAHTMLRQLYFAAFMQPFWSAVGAGTDETLRAIADKAVKEIAYHVRHAGEWVVRLGDGTEESARRMSAAIEELHPYTGELFSVTGDMQACIDTGALPDLSQLREPWQETIAMIFAEAKLDMPDIAYSLEGGRQGRHTEDFGHLLSELQYMQRTYPGLSW
jgi:ring-1,2-phenylacetyl-CoA epoxidase subunit PaaC